MNELESDSNGARLEVFEVDVDWNDVCAAVNKFESGAKVVELEIFELNVDLNVVCDGVSDTSVNIKKLIFDVDIIGLELFQVAIDCMEAGTVVSDLSIDVNMLEFDVDNNGTDKGRYAAFEVPHIFNFPPSRFARAFGGGRAPGRANSRVTASLSSTHKR